MSEKTRENRLRRAATRQGLTLKKSRTQDERALTFGTWWIINARTNVLLNGEDGFRDLDDVEAWLNGTYFTAAARS